MERIINLKKWQYIALSFTWGLIMSLLGAATSLVLLIMGYKPKKFGHSIYFEVGKGWGGLELGYFFIVCEDCSYYTLCHEHGHGFQNCVFGPLMPFLVCIPSAIRYWYREIKVRLGGRLYTDYDDIWFEGQATELGENFIKGSQNF